MKLKKIASLALAGIMAVSMLTACGEGGNSGNTEPENPVTPASNAVNYANQTLNSVSKDYMEYVSASWLDEALEKTATNKGDFSAVEIKDVFENNKQFSLWDDSWENTMAEKIVDSMSGKEAYTKNNYKLHSFGMMPANKTDKTIVWVETVSGALDERMAVTSVANTMSDWMVNDGGAVPTLDSDKYDCTYDLAISAVKVTNSSLTVESAWVVAIAVTQNVTEAANALA
ncbi:hypothetical protein [Faecalibacterium sp. An121]|uniref:hypothetical protein n=1 Tax=Faecalibacterium sp. An121 TaxID=1965550 RepID=UPI000B37525E|nr:hypothetical protein [Faecalibacterium sp. An121]OUQ39673.1 hypothetical protein B5E66_04275 [Faecalibacterium sp. An121]